MPNLNQATASIGVAVLPDDAGDAPTLFRSADRALYTAKKNGRNRVETIMPGKEPLHRSFQRRTGMTPISPTPKPAPFNLLEQTSTPRATYTPKMKMCTMSIYEALPARCVCVSLHIRMRSDSQQTIWVAVALFTGIYVLQSRDTNPVDAEEVLYVLPIVLLALRFGLRGGLSGALVGLTLIGVWGTWQGQDFGLSVWGYLSWAITFVLLGVPLGAFVDHRHKLETQIAHYFDGSLDLLSTIDLKGRFTRVNPAWERTLGYSAETLSTRPFIEFVHPDDRATTLTENDAVSQGTRDVIGFRNRYRTTNGSYRWLEWTGHAALDDGLINAVARDVTTQHEAEQQSPATHSELLEVKVTERTQELNDARAKTLKRLALAAEYRDDDTFEHTERVGTLSAEIATHLNLDKDQIEILRLAAPLHDVGKIGIRTHPAEARKLPSRSTRR